ncbi:two component transcriptional regulator, LuxR family [Bellilinea caldifistulae]|uniref:LuxR family transcriptional regulator n=1 Tax=Bellilinea caldifistulae TaxID=360411 RepID=A0A0P6X165_9CHLR|nr:response regulator transcription factor [Bellilinea caldifistulae]KPL73031.1 LuxR family transcriptional regulator [Bellilinea caldifistulae]GAP10984.1 two component transcriptional regulator, LuxR family [Bellilinea caldifistulae]
MNPKIKILLVDDQALFREGLRTLLDLQPDFEVVGEASQGEEALRMAVNLSPNVILMDLRMPVMDGVTATRRIKDSLPQCKVIVLTTFDDDEDVFEGLRAGAVGYLLKDVSSEKLYEAIRSAARGEYFLLPSITAKVMAEFSRLSRPARTSLDEIGVKLSSRELEVLRLVAQGASNKEIADTLVIAEGTVKNHLTNILAKLDARDRMQAVLRARELGLI